MTKIPAYPVILHWNSWVAKLARHDAVSFRHHIYIRGDRLTAKNYAHELYHVHQYATLKTHKFLCRYVRQWLVFGYAKMPLEVEAETYAVEHARDYTDLAAP